MRTLLTLGFGALVAFAFVLWVTMLAFAFLVVSFFDFLTWLTGDGLPVTIVGAIVAIAFGVAAIARRRGWTTRGDA